MSRTYRYRHGFGDRRGVCYTEARMNHRDDALEKQIVNELAHEWYKRPCLIGWGVWRRYYDLHAEGYSLYWHEFTDHYACLPDSGYHTWDQVHKAIHLRARVQNHWRNPYIGYGAQFCGRKKYYRTEGNRRGRHHDRQQLHELLSHTTAELRDANPAADKDLERPLSRKHTNWDNYSLT